MRIKICLLMLAIAGFSLLPNAPASATIAIAQTQRGMERCTVSDPTGTWLNVRSSPNGKKIVTKLKNGTGVFIEDYAGDAQDHEWVKVRLTGKNVNRSLGWVLREFLDCE